MTLRRFLGLLVGLLALLTMMLVMPLRASAATTAEARLTVTGRMGVGQISRAAPRPPNGAFLYRASSAGVGRLQIPNGNKQDDLVTLTPDGSMSISVYGWAHSSTTVGHIPNGTYRIYFTTGSRFNRSTGRLTAAAAYYRFNQRGTLPPNWRITLHPVPYGKAATTRVPPSEFPA